MLKIDALQKYENALLENFSPSVLRELKRSNWNGLLREIDRLYATMYHEWDALQKDVVDLEDAVKSLNWTVNPYTREGEEPGDLAREVAQVVTDALWARAAHEPGAIGHTFPQLIGALVHHRLRGFNVHQIVWKKAGDLVFPARYIQLPPQFMVWETKAGQPDRLLLVEDGMSANGVPFPPHQYIVALNHNGPDHPLYNATFYSLVNWFVAYKFGLGWFMEYAQKYGMPKQVIRYANEKDRQQIVDDLSDETVLNTVLIKEGQGTGFEMQYPSGGAASLPQAVLVQKAEEACHKAILGQTLTSDTSASGGSLAQAKVHAGVQADVVMKLAEAVADILNQQLVPSIIQANYGRVQGLPIPELRCKLPQAVASIERAQFLKTALEVPGMKVLKSEAYEYLNLTQPGEEDEVFEAQATNAQGGPGGPFGGGCGFPGMGGGVEQGGEGLPDGDAKDEVVMSSRGVKKNEPAEAWLAPLKKKLAEARSSGASLSELREKIRAWKTDRRALADAMARNIAAGFERGAAAPQGLSIGEKKPEEVAAVRGCNQHEHKPECEGANENEGQESEEKTMVTSELELFDGYHINQFGHGEISDLEQLRTFLLGEPVDGINDNAVDLGSKKIVDIAKDISDWYKEKGNDVIHVEKVGDVILDKRGIKDSAGHFLKNSKTTAEHKQRVADALYLVPSVLKKGKLIEYGTQINDKNITSFLFAAPVKVGKKDCVMVTRVRKTPETSGKFYLHGVRVIATLTKKAPENRFRDSGNASISLGVNSGASEKSFTNDSRDVFMIPKKALEVKASRQEKEDTFYLTRLVDMILT